MISSTTPFILTSALLFAAFGLSAPAQADTATDLNCKGCVGKKDLGKNAVDTKRIKDNSIKPSDLHKSAKPAGKSGFGTNSPVEIDDSGYVSVGSAAIDAPGPGFVTAFVTWIFSATSANAEAHCYLDPTAGGPVDNYTSAVSDGHTDFKVPAALVDSFPVPAGNSAVHLKCWDLASGVTVDGLGIQLIFTPNNYEPVP